MTREEAAKLKKGDKVKCINREATPLIKDVYYEISRIGPSIVFYYNKSSKKIDRLSYGQIIIDDFPNWFFCSTRFEK